jgi:hypothetical protein
VREQRCNGGARPQPATNSLQSFFHLLITAFLFSTAAHAAGSIEATTGPAQIESIARELRLATVKSRVNYGETLITAAAELRVRLDDGALLVLRPNSRLTVTRLIARGRATDAVELSLLTGAARVLTGWVGRADGEVQIETPHGRAAIRGNEAEVAVGADGTFVRAIDGNARADNAAGSVSVASGNTARLSSVGRPQLLAGGAPGTMSRPLVLLGEAQRNAQNQAIAAQRVAIAANRSGGVNERGNARISDACAGDVSAPNAFDDFVRAYELGNVPHLNERLSGTLIGRQGVLDGALLDATRRRQVRFHFKDTQWQCGPDLTVINTSWEKRFLDSATLTPAVLTGRFSVLMQKERGEWKFAAFSGDNPFISAQAGGAGGNLGQIVFGPVIPLASIGATATTVPVSLEVIDADLIGRGSLPVQVVSNFGDAENLLLPEIAPGRFRLPQLNMSTGPVAPGDNVLQVASGVMLTVRYADINPGQNRPATVLTASLSAVGSSAPGVDTTPDPFVFIAQTGVAAGSTVTSNSVTITGINAPAPVSVSGGTVSIAGGAFAAAGTITNGQSLTVRVTASSTAGATVAATVTVGGVVAVFNVTTAAAGGIDTTPDAFSFAAATGAPGALVASNTVTITGINAPAPVVAINGEVSVAGGAFTPGPTTITNGQTLAVRTTASLTNGAVVTATVSVGGVAAAFNVTTVADTTPDAFAFTPVTNAVAGSTVTSNTVTITGINAPATVSVSGGLVSVAGGAFTATPGTIANGQTLQARVTASGTAGAAVIVTVNVGGVVGTFTVTTAGGGVDTTPNPFSFISAASRPLAVDAFSNEIVITGINAPAPVTLVNGLMSVNGGAFGPAPATIVNGTAIRLRHTTASASFANAVSTLTIGGVTGTFTSTTGDGDPDVIAFPTNVVANPATLVSSPCFAPVTGFSVSSLVSIVGGEYAIAGSNATNFTSAPGRISPGDQICVRLTSSPAANGTASTTVTIGATASTFTPRTLDFAPDAFTFTPVTNAPKNSPQVSNVITIAGLEPGQAFPFNVTNGEWAFVGGGFSTGSAPVQNGSQLQVRVTTSNADNTPTTATIQVGFSATPGTPPTSVGYTTTFTATTGDGTPNAFSLQPAAAITPCPAATGVYSSATVAISGLTIAAPISIAPTGIATSAQYSINGGALTSAPGTIANGQTVRVQVNVTCPGAGGLTGVNPVASLTIGGVTVVFNVP